jgi:hypothetical protein
MNRSILSHRQRLDALFRKVSSIKDIADQSEWSKYLCVLVSGFLEESLRVLLEEYARIHSSTNIQNFLEAQISSITNCKTSKIIDILNNFSNDWKEEFINQIQAQSQIADEIKNSIDSVVTNRHQIAHGKNVGLRYSTVANYYENVKKAVEILEAIIR